MWSTLKTALTSILLFIAMCFGANAAVSENHALGNFLAVQHYVDQNPEANQLASLENFGFYQKHASECCNATNSGVDGTAGSIRDVNPTGGTQNCVNCAIATDNTLAGFPTSALPGNPTSVRVLEEHFGTAFQSVTGPQNITNIMTNAGDGARGIVFGSRGPNEVGHVFNVVNQNGTIRFLDGQTGTAADLNSGYQQFFFLPTN